MSLPQTLERKDGTTVSTVEALAGKLVVLYFSAEWCGACRTFTPALHALYEEAAEQDKPLEVVFVSSDRNTAQQQAYMDGEHGDWLRVPFADEAARDALKARYGCFAGAEVGRFKGVSRRAGIPAMVAVGPNGEERAHMDCDPPAELNRKGFGLIDEWLAKFTWP
jgi:thiol-disulfide isomerase/thioredoxin